MGRVAVVTGAASHTRLAIARHLAARGHAVRLLDDLRAQLGPSRILVTGAGLDA
jgi:NAD(P)-dependent dehydrogenase (short-subunit alcohol dehydrogenase family)